MSSRIAFVPLLVLFVMVALPGSARAQSNPSAEVQQRLDEAARSLEKAMPILLNTIDVLRTEMPGVVDIMRRASERGAATVPKTWPTDSKRMPSTEQLTSQLEGLKSVLNILHEVVPRMQRMQQRIQDGAREGRTPSPPPARPSAPSRPAAPAGSPGFE